jgi:hypothetical protein
MTVHPMAKIALGRPAGRTDEGGAGHGGASDDSRDTTVPPMRSPEPARDAVSGTPAVAPDQDQSRNGRNRAEIAPGLSTVGDADDLPTLADITQTQFGRPGAIHDYVPPQGDTAGCYLGIAADGARLDPAGGHYHATLEVRAVRDATPAELAEASHLRYRPGPVLRSFELTLDEHPRGGPPLPAATLPPPTGEVGDLPGVLDLYSIADRTFGPGRFYDCLITGSGAEIPGGIFVDGDELETIPDDDQTGQFTATLLVTDDEDNPTPLRRFRLTLAENPRASVPAPGQAGAR